LIVIRKLRLFAHSLPYLLFRNKSTINRLFLGNPGIPDELKMIFIAYDALAERKGQAVAAAFVQEVFRYADELSQENYGMNLQKAYATYITSGKAEAHD
jgi:hypothetical protein